MQQELVGVRNSRERCAAVSVDRVPELAAQNAVFREDDRCASEQVAVQHRETVGVRHRKGSDRALRGRELQVLGDGSRVGLQVYQRKSDELGAAGGTGGVQ